ncbi:HNH endonuclease [Archangium sp.]|uniref:HNH endonuclease n=1 Tax=Archangium sp. TaxID=1872627 RepID=UPI00389ADD9A
MPPEFSTTTKDVLAKRAAHLCSNPDCRTTTSGPTADPQKAISIGEAAHVFGALPGSARYRADMTDGARAEITNGIWLCRNCHKLIDNDALSYPADLLFSWRHEHENYVTEKLGNRTEVLRLQLRERSLEGLFDENPLAKQIAREKLNFWEYRLTAELLRSNLKRPSRRWSDLKSNLRVHKRTPVADKEIIRWFQVKLAEGMDYMDPLKALYSVQLQKAWGLPGEPGDAEEIAHVCQLIGNIADELVRWEEEVMFAWVSDTYRPLINLFQGVMGRQLEKLLAVPAILDGGIDQAEAHPGEETIIEHTVVFDVPEGWEEAIKEGLQKIENQFK